MSTLNRAEPPETLTTALREREQELRQRLTEGLEALPVELQSKVVNELDQQLLYMMVCSEYIADEFSLRPEMALEVLAEVHGPVLGLDAYCRRGKFKLGLDNSDDLGAAPQVDTFQSALRLWRHHEMTRIAWRDLGGYVDVLDILAELSDFAEASIKLTLDFVEASMQRRFGKPRCPAGTEQRLLVLAMGKLGGRELNFSSDIDLILCYPSAGVTDGERSLSNEEFFRKVAQQFQQCLGKVTEHGFVFRVDLRLRPFGDSGPLVMNFDGLEHYYVTQGREWERYAMIKARPVAGSQRAQEELMSLLYPFIYRRYLDYNALGSLRDLKRQIQQQVRQQRMQKNLKLGAGGIREIEFIAQSFQLVRGGRERELQSRSLVATIHALPGLRLLDGGSSERLLAAYDFLRRSENRLQMFRNQQTHSLPEADAELQRLAYSMNGADTETYLRELDEHREYVNSLFDEVLQLEATETAPEADNVSSPLWNGEISEAAALELLREMGFVDADEVWARIESLRTGGMYRNLSTEAQQRVDRIMPLILSAAAETDAPDRSQRGLIDMIRAVAGRSGYLQILIEQSQALRRLAVLFAGSSWLAEFVCEHPIVIDELLDHEFHNGVPDHQSLLDAADLVYERIEAADLDVQLDAVRHFRHSNVMRVAAAEIMSELAIGEASVCLARIADVSVEMVVRLVLQQLVARHGKPTYRVQGEIREATLAILAYGKLGSRELSYGSDLDLVFLHDSEGESQQTNGERSLDNNVFFARVAQKIVHFITVLTPAGTLYEIDTRLRPNGRAGLLVSRLQAFAQYQHTQAWTWEHQALVRTRVIFGADEIRQQVRQIRAGVLCQSREQLQLSQDVREMRERMHHELARSKRGWVDLKQDRGGIADIEFMVQYMVLLHADQYHELVECSENEKLLAVLASSGLLAAASANALDSAYLVYRSHLHHNALNGLPGQVPEDAEIARHREAVIGIWNQLFDDTVSIDE